MTANESALSEFKASLLTLDDQSMLDRFYYGRPATMLPMGSDPLLRRSVAQMHGVAMRDVIITGSAKVGFTTVAKAARPIFSAFGDSSDIDVAIISRDLFLTFWRRTMELGEDQSWPHRKEFRRYLSMGWIRPDKLPSGEDFPERKQWFEGFQELTASGEYGPYKITAGVYYDEAFWEKYACRALKQCRHYVENAL
jgi:hypothetical protein